MSLIYIAGPYRARTKEGIENNIAHARAAMLKLMAEGWVVICPHTMTAHCDGLLRDNDFIRNGLNLIEKCDAVYVLKGSEYSSGALMEIGLAKSMGKEIILQARS